MKHRILFLFLLFLSLSVTAQDLTFNDVKSAFSHKELPPAKAIRSYKAINGQIYNVGDEIEIGQPKEQNSNRFSYITQTTSEYSGVTVVINNFIVIKIKNLEMGTVASIGAVVLCAEKNKYFFVNNFDLAIENSELIRKSNSNLKNNTPVTGLNTHNQATQNPTANMEVTTPKPQESPKSKLSKIKSFFKIRDREN